MSEIAELHVKLEGHIKDFENYQKEYSFRQAEQESAQERTTLAIEALTKSTQGLVDAWKLASSFQLFVKWLSSFAMLGAAGSWLYSIWPIIG